MEVDLITEETEMSDNGLVRSADQEGNEENDKEAANLLETVAIWLTQYIQVQ